jgi:hypothetical protein
MTKQEKLDQLSTLLEIPGNTTRVIRHFLLAALGNIEDDTKLDAIIALLSVE